MLSSMYIGATGLKSHAEGMNVITNNLANVNTVGYKQMSMQYADLMSQYLTVGSANLTNVSQKGSGAAPGANRTLFVQGGFETGSAATDIAINGIGFFAVTDGDQTHYTRAGNFRFNNAGELLDASGWNVMGRAFVNGVESSTTSPIVLDTTENGAGFMPAKASTTLTIGSRLGGVEDKTSTEDNPFFALAAAWDGTSDPPLQSGAYSYSEVFQFYDSTGASRSATIYYDAVGSQGGLSALEYLVALNPSEDASALAETKAAGLLMAGTLTFSANGELASLTAFSPPASGDPADLSAWTPAALQDGHPVMNVQATDAEAQTLALDMGLTFTGGATDAGGGLSSAAEAAGNPSSIYSASANKELSANASTLHGDSPATFYENRDGYASGGLRELQVTADGIIQGIYSNGQTQDLHRVTLYRFTSQDGLRHEGNNHYSATQESGPAEEGIPGDENFGTLTDYSLEQSNVDYAREFSLLIVTQRGFQMNSKVITTTDTMLQRALELKR